MHLNKMWLLITSFLCNMICMRCGSLIVHALDNFQLVNTCKCKVNWTDTIIMTWKPCGFWSCKHTSFMCNLKLFAGHCSYQSYNDTLTICILVCNNQKFNWNSLYGLGLSFTYLSQWHSIINFCTNGKAVCMKMGIAKFRAQSTIVFSKKHTMYHHRQTYTGKYPKSVAICIATSVRHE